MDNQFLFQQIWMEYLSKASKEQRIHRTTYLCRPILLLEAILTWMPQLLPLGRWDVSWEWMPVQAYPSVWIFSWYPVVVSQERRFTLWPAVFCPGGPLHLLSLN